MNEYLIKTAIPQILAALTDIQYELEIRNNDFLYLSWTDGPSFNLIACYMSVDLHFLPCRLMRQDSKTGKKQVMNISEY